MTPSVQAMVNAVLRHFPRGTRWCLTGKTLHVSAPEKTSEARVQAQAADLQEIAEALKGIQPKPKWTKVDLKDKSTWPPGWTRSWTGTAPV